MCLSMLDLQGQTQIPLLTKLPPNFHSFIKYTMLMATQWRWHSCLVCWAEAILSLPHPWGEFWRRHGMTHLSHSHTQSPWHEIVVDKSLDKSQEASHWNRYIYLLCLSFLLCKMRMLKIYMPKVEVKIIWVNIVKYSESFLASTL